MTQDYDYGVQTRNNCNNFVVFSLLCSYYVNDIIKKLEFHLLIVIILLVFIVSKPLEASLVTKKPEYVTAARAKGLNEEVLNGIFTML